MPKRKCPYGYEMIRGRIAVCIPEAETIRWIFENRAAGRSNWNMAVELYNGSDPYFKDGKKQSSCKISSILYDDRYIGADGFEPIVDETLFNAVQKLKGEQYCKIQKQRAIGGRKEIVPHPHALPTSITYIPDDTVWSYEKELKAALRSDTPDADAIKDIILNLASAKYDCIK